jgi:transcriptional regulator with XRE-family HTH domain
VNNLDPNLFCKNFLRLRRLRGFTQESLAEAIGSTHATINRWESGKSKPNYLDFYKLMIALEVSFEGLSGVVELPEDFVLIKEPTPIDIISAAIADAITAGGYEIKPKS